MRDHATFVKKIITLLFLALFFMARVDKMSAATLDQIRLSWQHDPKTTITIMWRTEGNLTPRVQYGTTTNYGSETFGTANAAVLDGYFYNTVELTGLTPTAIYHYRVSGDGAIWSDDFTFRTAPSGPADFSFTVFGDNGLDTTSSGNPKKVKDLVVAQQAAIHFIAGDLTYADGESNKKSAWEQWFTEMGRISQTIPSMPAIGNHERDRSVKFPSGELFYTRSFALPPENNEEYYSFDYGDVHFTVINSDEYTSLKPGKTQYQWIINDLASTTKRFKIAVFHHMAYSSGARHAVLHDVQNNLSPLFDQYDVDLVFTGHNHLYERTYPLRYGSFGNPIIGATGTAYTNPDATVYVVTGGGGHGLHSFNEQPSWIASRCQCYEIVRVDVDDAGILTVSALGVDGSTVDRFTISKTSAVVAPSPPSPPLNQNGVGSGLAPDRGGAQSPALQSDSAVANQQSIRGFNFAIWWHDILEKDSTRRSIDNLKATGANYFGLAPFWYQENKTATTIARRSDKTATDASVRSSIRYAKSAGLKVALKPMVDSRDGTWRGQLAPLNTDAWFQSYKDFILNYARIAQEEGIEYFIVGTEFASLTKPQYSGKWREIIRDIRAVYSGPLTYAANWGKRDEGEYYQMDFWDALDAIGIDAYFPLSENNTPTVQSIMNAWTSISSGGRQNWFSDIKALHDRFKKPVIFTEIGYLSCDGTGKKPWKYPCGASLDGQEQADLYEGTLTFWKEYDWMMGFLFWRWDADPNKGSASDKDYLVFGKPVVDVLKRFWTESSTVLTGAQSSATAQSSLPSTSGSSTAQLNPPINQSANLPPPFSYGKPRLRYPATERAKAWELSRALRQIFHGTIPIKKQYWQLYVNAYIYGNYPAEIIARSLRLGGKVVHPSIPWSVWRNSRDYKQYKR